MGGASGFESTSHQVAHLVREVESSLRSVVGILAERRPAAALGVSSRSPLRLVLRKLADWLHRILLRLDEASADWQKDLERPRHADEVREILRGLNLPETGVVGKAWLRHTGRLGFHARAHRRHLSTPRPTDADFAQFWQDAQAILDAVLEQFEKRFVEVQDMIDVLLEKEHPTRGDVAVLRERIPNNLVGLGRFFGRLTHPGWLQPLKKARLLSDPPAAEHDETGGGISFPPWPAGQYLARMAKVGSVQKVVLETLINLPETDNVCIHEAIVEAALAARGERRCGENTARRPGKARGQRMTERRGRKRRIDGSGKTE
jgi:hypothetical protein